MIGIISHVRELKERVPHQVIVQTTGTGRSTIHYQLERMGETLMRWSIPEKVIERGRTYLKEGRVLSVSADPARRVWHGEVLGSELYLVDLDVVGKKMIYANVLIGGT